MTDPGMPDPGHPAWPTIDALAESLGEIAERMVSLLGPEYAVLCLVGHCDGPAQLAAAGSKEAIAYPVAADMLETAAAQLRAMHQAGTS